MKTKHSKKVLSVILCLVLLAATALIACGCSGGKEKNATVLPAGEVRQVGEGEKQFTLLVTDKDGSTTAFAVRSDEETVGAALMELGLIAGDEGPYGLYVKEVNGISADYDKDGVYWAFYCDGEMAMSGVDQTDIAEGAEYELRVAS